ncbi:hypothetical protein KR200_003957 [Drosophila serrata]|nr:hypothetical protein KR200_003957 [Drosophila serrata]
MVKVLEVLFIENILQLAALADSCSCGKEASLDCGCTKHP